MSKTYRVGVVIVAYGHEAHIPFILRSLIAQAQRGDRFVVVDNHPERRSAAAAAQFDGVEVIEADNDGFSSGCNTGAARVADDVDVLFFLNPDTLPGDNVLDVVRGGCATDYAAWMPLLVLPDETVNSAGNVVHISGLSWCDGYLDAHSKHTTSTPITVLSGACAAVRTDWWRRLGGMSETYFLYYEDTDLSTRLLLAGGTIGLLPQATVTHDYDFEKGTYKWLYLERNRWVYMLQTWPTAVLAVLGLQLIAVELGLWVVAVAQRRFLLKVRASLQLVRLLPTIMRERRRIQAQRTCSAADFFQTLTYRLDAPQLGRIGQIAIVRAFFTGYYRLAGKLLRVRHMR